ncbi:hypothetical protein [Helicobacter sp. T3_23-1059]
MQKSNNEIFTSAKSTHPTDCKSLAKAKTLVLREWALRSIATLSRNGEITPSLRAKQAKRSFFRKIVRFCVGIYAFLL